MDINGDQWKSMEIFKVHQDRLRSMDIHADPWRPGEIQGNPWSLLGSLRSIALETAWRLCGGPQRPLKFRWNSIGSPPMSVGYPTIFSMDLHQVSMDPHGSPSRLHHVSINAPWISMGLHEYPWSLHQPPSISMKAHGSPWTSMNLYGGLEISIDLRGFHGGP